MASFLCALVGAAALTAGAPAAAPAAAVVGEWRFDEPAGQTALDTGPHGLDGVLGATAEVDAGDPARIPGNSGNALRFGGASFVRLPDASELAPPTLTAEAVVRRTGSPGNWRYVISRGGQGCFSGSYGLYTGAAGGIAFYVFDGSYYVVSATARPEDVWDGSWHHVAGTFDGTGLRLWLDGRPIGAPSAGPTRIDYASSTTTTAIGRYFGTCDLVFTGDVDFVRLSSGAFSAAEVQAATAKELRPGLTTAPLPAAAPATRLDAEQPDGGPRSVAPPAPKRTCQLRLSRTRIAAGRRASVRVRVIRRGRSLRGVRVLAHRRAKARPIARARTGARGARLTFVMRRAGRLRITAAISPRCSPRYIRVVRKR